MMTCTVGPTATTGTRCGKPAVTTFTSPTGRVYAECADHAVGFASSSPVVTVGARVGVFHVGLRKIGTVVSVGRTRCRVEVPLYKPGTTKVITVPIAEVTAL